MVSCLPWHLVSGASVDPVRLAGGREGGREGGQGGGGGGGGGRGGTSWWWPSW